MRFNNQNKTSKFLERIEKYNGYAFEKNKFIIIGVAVVTIICLFYFNKVEFDSDMSSINYESLAIQEAEKKLRQCWKMEINKYM